MSNLYIWDSQAYKNYSTGDIIVLADSVEEAKLKILNNLPRLINQIDHKIFGTESLQQFIDALDLDLRKPPKVLYEKEAVHTVEGSS